jgi:hypothetical protein
MDLVEQGLEAFVFVQPCANLGKQFLGDIDGTGLAVLFEGEVLSTYGEVRRGDSGRSTVHSDECTGRRWQPRRAKRLPIS